MGRKIGIMGGTFDPIHMSHLILAETAYQELDLDVIWFMPSGNPPHKRQRDGRGTDEQRVQMVALAIEDNPHFELSLEDMVKDEYSYTYRLLERFQQQYPEDEFYFLIGADSLFDFHKWKEPARICQLCTLVVATRDHITSEQFDHAIEQVSKQFHGTFLKLSMPELDISSNQIRSWTAEGRSIRYYVPETVRTYIEDQNMYRNE